MHLSKDFWDFQALLQWSLTPGHSQGFGGENADLPQENVHVNACDDDKNVTCMKKKMTK